LLLLVKQGETMATILFFGAFVLLLVLSLAGNAFFLQLGSRWVMIPNVSFGRALSATVAVALVNLVLMAPLGCIPPVSLGWAILALVLETALLLGLTWLIIAKIFKTSMSRAFAAWLPTLIPAACLCGIAVFVGRLYLFEAFKISTNSMAPTILGRHWEAPCPRCGSPAYCAPQDERWKSSNRPVLMICSKERRSCEIANPPYEEHGGDRTIVNKLLHPQRWDVIIFQWPEDPTIKYCARLVGLPGETVTIHDGAVWIDGRKQTPPESCRGVEYLDRFASYASPFWGSEERPAKLASDECFVLGDFSARSRDSRLWEKGAAGHPPYAVPVSYVVGVVTHIYWPPERCRALR
jgi:signal peptidase I